MTDLQKAMELISNYVAEVTEDEKNDRTRSKIMDDGWVGCMLLLIPVGKGAMLVTIDQGYLPEDATFGADGIPNEYGVYDLRGDYKFFQDYQNALNEYNNTEL